MPSTLLVYLSADFTEEDAAGVAALGEALAARRAWTLGPPAFVDDTDSSSCTRPEDEPIRTVGLWIDTSDPGEVPGTPREEVEAFISALAELSRERRVEMEEEYRDELIGHIEDGELSRSVWVGLLDTW